MGEANRLKRFSRDNVDAGFAVPVLGVRGEDIEKRCRLFASSRDFDVFENAEIVENPDVLKRPREAESRDAVRLETKNFFTLDTNRPSVRVRGAAERVEQGRLAGAVGSDNRLHDAFGDIEIDIVECDKPTKATRHPAGHNDRFSGQCAPARRNWNCDATDASPPGARTMTAMTPRP